MDYSAIVTCLFCSIWYASQNMLNQMKQQKNQMDTILTSTVILSKLTTNDCEVHLFSILLMFSYFIWWRYRNPPFLLNNI